MEEMSFEYWNNLADQIIMISSLLGGFSIAVVANLLVSKKNTPLLRNIMKTSVLAASFFLVTVFAWTKILMMTTNGFPYAVSNGDLTIPTLIGTISFLFGVISLLTMIALSGWTKSKSMGRFTSVIGALTLILVLLMLS